MTEFIDLSGVNLDDTFEPEVLPAGEEVELVITSMLFDTNKNGDRYMMPFFDVVDQPTVKDITDYIELPHERMAPKDLNNAKLKIVSLGQAFSIDFSGQLDIKNDVVSQKGFAILGVGKDRDAARRQAQRALHCEVNAVEQYARNALEPSVPVAHHGVRDVIGVPDELPHQPIGKTFHSISPWRSGSSRHKVSRQKRQGRRCDRSVITLCI